MDVKLAKIGRDIFDDVIALELEEAQKNYLPSNVFSIAESTLSASFHPRAIVADGEIVGFLMYQFGKIGESDEDDCTVWRFTIDRRRQNGGIGTTAMGLLLEETKAHGRCSSVDLYYCPDDIAAKKRYARLGFEEVGDRDDGTVIAEIRR